MGSLGRGEKSNKITFAPTVWPSDRLSQSAVIKATSTLHKRTKTYFVNSRFGALAQHGLSADHYRIKLLVNMLTARREPRQPHDAILSPNYSLNAQIDKWNFGLYYVSQINRGHTIKFGQVGTPSLNMYLLCQHIKSIKLAHSMRKQLRISLYSTKIWITGTTLDRERLEKLEFMLMCTW